MKRLFTNAFVITACVFLFGCAHPISMNPDLATVAAPAGIQTIDKKVGYYLPDALRTVEVTTPGGGGDQVKYFPYRDIEPGFYKALAAVFSSVSKVPNQKDSTALKASGISLLITPEITTTSASDSAFTWPPTQFTVNLVCTVVDANGASVETIRVSGQGEATFSEFKSNLSLAATRASNDALNKLIKALSESPRLSK
jgi:hypothetical protein